MRISLPSVVAGFMVFCGGSAGAIDWVNEIGPPNELEYVVLQFPATLNVVAGHPTSPAFGRVFHTGVTASNGPAAQVVAQLGYGPSGTDPRTNGSWQWVTASYNQQFGNDDEYQATLTVVVPGTYSYTYRFSLEGTHFTAADLDGAGSGPDLIFELGEMGVLTVTPDLIAVLDIDGNGSNDPLKDGLLVLRYMFGFRGATLISGAVDTEHCVRCNATDIEAFFEGLKD